MNSVANEFEDSFEDLKISQLIVSYNHDQRQAHHILALTNNVSAIMDKKNTASMVLISMTIPK